MTNALVQSMARNFEEALQLMDLVDRSRLEVFIQENKKDGVPFSVDPDRADVLSGLGGLKRATA